MKCPSCTETRALVIDHQYAPPSPGVTACLSHLDVSIATIRTGPLTLLWILVMEFTWDLSPDQLKNYEFTLGYTDNLLMQSLFPK